jgi:transcriptional regulator with XRE-family HTH domain
MTNLAGEVNASVDGPTLVRRQLGRRLRTLRESAGKTTSDVSVVASRSKLWRIEEGRTAVRVGDARELARLYGADETTVDAMGLLAQGTRTKGWWEDYRSLVPDWFGLYIGLESSCNVLSHYHPELIHGLLQTPDYARAAVAIDGPRDEEVIEGRLRMRMNRVRGALERSDLEIRVILGAGALSLVIGSGEIMSAQLDHLRVLNARGNIDIRVLPWRVGAHFGLHGHFTLMDFHDPDDPPVVYEESIAGARYLEQTAQVDEYRRAFTLLSEQAVPIEEYTP